MASKTKQRNNDIRAEEERKASAPFSPSEVWTKYGIDQARWRIEVNAATSKDKAAVAYADAHPDWVRP
jgi:hypothetical protein